ncbi:MAG: hypothetical protein CVU56_19535 [Deltaproteobacteria bacterium HGW-Deltaproteobacteria-14]|jgi:RNase P subunit RPR2|nr:MAG: hypothetical protein CVU56_19535 [Deltaproteobacteria bacterium HGW-Deltaproteobacteria-14]
MASNAGDIVKAHCSHCKVDVDAQVVAAVGDEIVTITCRTCGTSQRFRVADEDGGGADRGAGRRVVDVEPRKNKKPRNRARRVVSTTGREIPDVSGPPRPFEGTNWAGGSAATEPNAPPSRTPAVPTFDDASDEARFKRWDAATDRVDQRYARPHRANESYEVGEAILDKAHGMGIVEKVDGDEGTLTVLFKQGYIELPSVPRHLRPQHDPFDDDADEED